LLRESAAGEQRARARQGCNLAHVLGLYRMTGAPGAAFALGARGALADVALWAIARLQTRLFASRTFAKRAPARAAQLQKYSVFFSCARVVASMHTPIAIAAVRLTHQWACPSRHVSRSAPTAHTGLTHSKHAAGPVSPWLGDRRSDAAILTFAPGRWPTTLP
jgi:hypothetical protein